MKTRDIPSEYLPYLLELLSVNQTLKIGLVLPVYGRKRGPDFLLKIPFANLPSFRGKS